MDTKCAIITGMAGQDGSYLVEFLLTRDYTIFGIVRRSSNMSNLDRLPQWVKQNKKVELIYGDVTDITTIQRVLNKAAKMTEGGGIIEFYNLAAQSHVKVSFDVPKYTAEVDGIGTLNVLESVLQMGLAPRVRIYQASTSELYGSTPAPQNESSRMAPQSPYAISKLFSYWMIKNYRDAHDMYAVNGILFNHESERRPENFVSRKITKHVASIYHMHPIPFRTLKLGNLYAKRDWGYAKDYIIAMWMMLQQDKPDDFVIATGHQHTVKEFVECAFGHIDVVLEWKGEGLDEKGYNALTGKVLVEIDEHFFRPTEVHSLRGDCTYATEKLGWKATTSFSELVSIMVESDIRKMSQSEDIQ